MFNADAPADFARKLTTLLKVRHCFLTSSGTAALYVALVSLSKLAQKKEVIFPAYTCPSVLAAVIRAGLKPVLCDLGCNKSTMDLDGLAGTITSDTLAVISVHLFGIREKRERINQLLSSRNIFHIEDAAQSLGLTTAENRVISRPGCSSDIGIFSFGRGKPLSLLQGGALVTDSDTIADAVRREILKLQQQNAFETARLVMNTALYALFFHPRLYWMARLIPLLKLGKTIFDPHFKIKKINAFTCALGNIMIDRVPHIIKIRRHKENLLHQRLAHCSDHMLSGSQDGDALIRFPLLMQNYYQRESVLSGLVKYGLGATAMYEAPLHLFKDTKHYFPGAVFPNAQLFSERILTLPLHAFVTARDISTMSSIISRSCNRNK